MAKSTNLLHLEEFCRGLSVTYVAPAERDSVQVYKAYKDKRPENMLKPDSPFYLAVNYFKTEGELKAEGSKWFKSQPMGVNKLNSLMKEVT